MWKWTYRSDICVRRYTSESSAHKNNKDFVKSFFLFTTSLQLSWYSIPSACLCLIHSFTCWHDFWQCHVPIIHNASVRYSRVSNSFYHSKQSHIRSWFGLLIYHRISVVHKVYATSLPWDDTTCQNIFLLSFSILSFSPPITAFYGKHFWVRVRVWLQHISVDTLYTRKWKLTFGIPFKLTCTVVQ